MRLSTLVGVATTSRNCSEGMVIVMRRIIALLLCTTLGLLMPRNKHAQPLMTTSSIYAQTTETYRTENEHEPPPATYFTPRWLAGLPEPEDSYWDKVAQCETDGDWEDRGNFAGGLGIAYATWLGYGGEEFAPKQWLATRGEQIEVANRIALHGYMNSRGQFTEPVGFNGWGCIRNNNYLKPPVDNPWQQAR